MGNEELDKIANSDMGEINTLDGKDFSYIDWTQILNK